jgi:hypothetical protein
VSSSVATSSLALLPIEMARLPLRYFPKSPIKRDYVLFTDSTIGTPEATHLIGGDDMQS